MKIRLVLLPIVSLLSFQCAKKSVIGHYENLLGREIYIKDDSTFSYHKKLGIGSDGKTWAKGKWTISHDTIFFTFTPISDTLRRKSREGKITDTIILSLDDKSTLKSYGIDSLGSIILENTNLGKQDSTTMPRKLYFTGEKLYEIDKNGNLVTAKRKYSKSGKYLFDPWFIKK